MEIKKSDADLEASKWQLLYYLRCLENKGIYRKGKLQCVEKNKSENKVIYVELTEDIKMKLNEYIIEIENLLAGNELPEVLKNKNSCKKCSYFEYCYI